MPIDALVMQLWAFDSGRFPALDSQTVRRRGLAKLYYVHDGRNAWYTTWVQRYLDGCIHTTFDSAKDYAESLRVQGSVFYIYERPGLVIEGAEVVLVVTQINCIDVLAGYSLTAVRDDVGPGRKKIANAANNYLRRGSSLEGAFLSFEADSRFWRSTPADDSVIRVFGRTTLKAFEPVPGRCRGYRSFSSGASYRLGWTERGNEVRSTSLRQLFSFARRPKLAARREKGVRLITTSAGHLARDSDG
jgi:hypothetical protein